MHPWLVYTDTLSVPTYFFLLMTGFALASGLVAREARRSGVSERMVLDLCLVLLPSVLVGARIAHIVFEVPETYLANPGLLLSLDGGLVFYGGAGAAALLGIWWSRRHGVSYWTLCDIFTPATAFGLVYGRLGCLGAGCGHGRPATWPFGFEVPWSVRYYRRGLLPEELLAVPLHPAPLYESLGCLALFLWLSRVRARQTFAGQTALCFLLGYGGLRLVAELFRADELRGVYAGGWLSTSQAISLGLLACVPILWRRLSR